MNFIDKLKKVMEGAASADEIESLSVGSATEAQFLAVEVTKAVDQMQDVFVTLTTASCGCPCLGIKVGERPLRLMHVMEAVEFAGTLPKMSGILLKEDTIYNDDAGMMVHRDKARGFAKVALMSSAIAGMLHTKVLINEGWNDETPAAMTKAVEAVHDFFKHITETESESKGAKLMSDIERKAAAAFAEYRALGQMDGEAKAKNLQAKLTTLSKGTMGRTMMLAIVAKGGEAIELDDGNEKALEESEGIAFIGMNMDSEATGVMLVHRYGEDDREIIDLAEKLIVDAGDFDRFMNGPLTTMRMVSSGLKVRPTMKELGDLIKGAFGGGQLRAVTPNDVVQQMDVKPAKLH